MDHLFGNTMTIGTDILDIGSRKAAERNGNKRQLGKPGAFDVPNVADVRTFDLNSTNAV